MSQKEKKDIGIFGTGSENANEYAIEWIRGRDYAGLTAPNGSALKNRILRFKESHPDDITNLVINKDGSIFCHIPINYVKISPPRQMSEEQKQAASERLRRARENQKENSKENEKFIDQDDLDDDFDFEEFCE